ncbi:hypothetical protein [Yoonia sp. SS1-5]|uniref:Uncharacterized protein n=1 Tax=Yoonia rhodophyticola TaxID=3137370 RepID=A0AAN0MCS1_9RHOB
MAEKPQGAEPDTGHLGLWRLISWISIGTAILVGLAYVAAQIAFFGRVADPLFVFIIALNTCIGAIFGFQFETRLRALIVAFNAQEEDAARKMEIGRAFRNIFNDIFAIPAAICFACFIAGWVYLLAPWAGTGTPDQARALNWLLTVFLFCGNLMIGYGLYCILRFWLLSARRISKIKLNIFNPTRPDIAIYQDITKRIVILVAVVATLAVISLPLSVITVGVTAFLFSLSALATVMATYLVPMLPLTAKFQETRVTELNRVEKHIDAVYEQMVDADDPGAYRGKMDELVALREQVRKIKTLPPGGEFSIFTAVGVSILTFLPTIFEHLLGLVSF